MRFIICRDLRTQLAHVMSKSPVIKWLSQPNTYWRNWSNCFVCHPLCRWPGATKLSFLCPWLFRKSRQNWKLSLSLPDLKMSVQQFLLHLFHLFIAPRLQSEAENLWVCNVCLPWNGSEQEAGDVNVTFCRKVLRLRLNQISSYRINIFTA